MTVGPSEQGGEFISRRIKYTFASTAVKRPTRRRLAPVCIATPVPCWGREGDWARPRKFSVGREDLFAPISVSRSRRRGRQASHPAATATELGRQSARLSDGAPAAHSITSRARSLEQAIPVAFGIRYCGNAFHRGFGLVAQEIVRSRDLVDRSLLGVSLWRSLRIVNCTW